MRNNLYILTESSLGGNTGVKTYVNQLVCYFSQYEYVRIHVIDLCLDRKEFEVETKERLHVYHIPIQWKSSLKKKKRLYRNIFYLLDSYLINDENSVFLINLFIHEEIIRLLKERYARIEIAFIIHYLDANFIIKGKLDAPTLTRLKQTDSYSLQKGEIGISHFLKRDMSVFKQADLIISLSHETEQLLHSFYQLKKDKTHTVYNGLKDEAVLLSYKEKCLLKNQNFIRSNERIILYVGRLDTNKGVLELIQAFRLVVSTIPDTRLILVGEGNYNQLLKECDGYWGKIIFTGHIDKEAVYRFYQIATIGVLPSYTEQSSFVAIEMMMHGLPLIGTTATGISEMIEEGITGYKINFCDDTNNRSLDVNCLAQRIEELLRDSGRMALFSQNSRTRYENYYQLHTMGEKMKKILNI